MRLTQEQIKQISKNLSKIPFDNPKIEEDLNNILKYFDLLQEVNTDNIIPTYSVITKEQNLREDILEEKIISKKELLDCSKQQIIADQITINNIMK